VDLLPLHADAMTASERDTDHGLLLRFRNAAGRWREWSMPMSLLKGSGEEFRDELLALGVRIDPASHRLLNAYLMRRHPKRRVLAATATGWHSQAVFVLPHCFIGNGDVRFQSEHAQHDEFTTAGDLDGWRREIAARCVGNPMLTLAVSAALAGPLLTKVHRPGGGFHWVGDSSTGKGTALSCGASVWGGPGFVRSWRATANGLEGITAALNDTALVLDQIRKADPRELGAVIYAIGNGTCKSRVSRTGGARGAARRGASCCSRAANAP
jgi:putative DNA primase/helicase